MDFEKAVELLIEYYSNKTENLDEKAVELLIEYYSNKTEN